MLHLPLLSMNRLNRTESAIFFSMVCSLLPEDLTLRTYLSSLQLMLCRVAALFIIIVQIIFSAFIYLKTQYCWSRCKGVLSVLYFPFLSMNSLNRIAIFFSMVCSLLPKDLTTYLSEWFRNKCIIRLPSCRVWSYMYSWDGIHISFKFYANSGVKEHLFIN